jgi:hypothetical protein
VNQELLLQNEYLPMSDPERATLAEIGKRLGRKMLAEAPVSPNRRRSWLGIGKLIAKKFDGSKHQQYPGRPKVPPEE